MESSEEARFVAQDFQFSNKNFVLALNEQMLNQKKSSFNKEIKKLNIRQPNQEHTPSTDRDTLLSASKCSEHPEEDVQFYCFNKDQLLCPECLVSGKYAGNEISNLKKAADKLKNRFGSLVIEGIGKFESFNLVEEQVEAYEEEIEKTTFSLEEMISKQMNEIRQKIDYKEQELLKNVITLRQERLHELKDSTKWLQDYREEIDNVKETGEIDFKNLGDLELCKYYSKKTSTIKSFIQTDNNFNTHGIKEIIASYRIKDKITWSKIEDDCKTIKAHLDSLGFPESSKIRQTTVSSTKETFRPTAVFAPDVTLTDARRGSKETVIERNVVPILTSTPRMTFLSKQPSEDTFELNLATKNSANKNLQKNLIKELEIARSTPRRENGLEIRLTPKEHKRLDAGTSLITELRRDNSKRTNRGGFSFNDTSSILENYRGMLTKRTSRLDSKTPKNISINAPLAKPFSSALSTPNNLLTTASLLPTPKVETREKSAIIKTNKNDFDILASESNKTSGKGFMRENESAYILNIEKMVAKRKTSERTSATNSNEFGLKKKLDRLSNELLNW